MGKNISFLFLCFCLLICGNISKAFADETTINLGILSCSDLQSTYENIIRNEIIKDDVTYEKCQQIYNKFNITSISNYYKTFNNNIKNNENKSCVIIDKKSENYNRHIYYNMWDDNVFCKFETFLSDSNSDGYKCQNGNYIACESAITSIGSHIKDINTRINNRKRNIIDTYKECELCDIKLQKANCRLTEFNIMKNNYSCDITKIGRGSNDKTLKASCQELIDLIEEAEYGNLGNGSYLTTCKNETIFELDKYKNILTNAETISCDYYGQEYNDYLRTNKDKIDSDITYMEFDEKLKEYKLLFDKNNCTLKSIEIQDKLTEVQGIICQNIIEGFKTENLTNSNLTCTETNITGCDNLITEIDNFINDEENDYNKYNCKAIDDLSGYKDEIPTIVCPKIIENFKEVNTICIETDITGCDNLITETDNFINDEENNYNKYNCKAIDDLSEYKDEIPTIVCPKIIENFKESLLCIEANISGCDNAEEKINTFINDENNNYNKYNCREIDDLSGYKDEIPTIVCKQIINDFKTQNSRNPNLTCTETNITGCDNLITEIEKFINDKSNDYYKYSCKDIDDLLEYKNQFLTAPCNFNEKQYSTLLKNIDNFIQDNNCILIESERSEECKANIKSYITQHNKYVGDNGIFNQSNCLTDLKTYADCRTIDFKFILEILGTSKTKIAPIDEYNQLNSYLKEFLSNNDSNYKQYGCNNNTSILPKYKNIYKEKICEIHLSKYENFLQNNTGKCIETDSSGCQTVIKSIQDTYINGMINNECSVDTILEAMCKKLEFQTNSISSDYTCDITKMEEIDINSLGDKNYADIIKTKCQNLINELTGYLEEFNINTENNTSCSLAESLKDDIVEYGKIVDDPKRAICNFYTDKYNEFHNNEYENFIDFVKLEGENQLICKIENSSYTPETCLDIHNTINKYEQIFEDNQCSYKPSKLVCDQIEFDFITNFTNSNCTTLSTNSDEQMMECYELLNEIDENYLLKYEQNNCITDELKAVKGKICNFYNDKYTEYINTVTNCDKNDNTNCDSVIAKIEEYENYFKIYNCQTSLQNTKCELINFNFFKDTSNLSCVLITDADKLNICNNLINKIDTYLIDMKNGSCVVTNKELESDRNEYNQIICNYYSGQYNQYITDNSLKCNFGSDISECQNIINTINSTYLDLFTSNKCTNELSKLQCNLLEFSFNKDSSNYICNINDTSTEDDIIKCQNLIKQIDNYLIKYKNNKCDADNLNKYKISYNKAICTYYNTQYENYLQAIVNNGLQCNEDSETDCTTIINEINEYSNIFRSNNCTTELSNSQCKLAEYNFKNKLIGFSCKLGLDNKITNEQDAEKCSEYIKQMDKYLSNINSSCNIKEQLQSDRTSYSTAICNFYGEKYNNFYNNEYTNLLNNIQNNDLKCNKNSDNGNYNEQLCSNVAIELDKYKTIFNTNNCTNREAKYICDSLRFELIADSSDHNCGTFNNNTPEETKNCYDFLNKINKTYKSKYKKYNCEMDDLLNVKNYICNSYKNNYDKYLERIGSGYEDALLCQNGNNKDCKEIINEIKDKYIYLFTNYECSENLELVANCKKLEFEFINEFYDNSCNINSATGKIEINDKEDLESCSNIVVEMNNYLKENFEKSGCSIPQELIDNINSYKEKNCEFNESEYQKYLERIVGYDRIINGLTSVGDNELLCVAAYDEDYDIAYKYNRDCEDITATTENYIDFFEKNNCTQVDNLKLAKCRKIEFNFNYDAIVNNKICLRNKDTGEFEEETYVTDCISLVNIMKEYLTEYDNLYKQEEINCGGIQTAIQTYKEEYNMAICKFYDKEYRNYLAKVNPVDHEPPTGENCTAKIGSTEGPFNCNNKCGADCSNVITNIKTYITSFEDNNCSNYVSSNPQCKSIEFAFIEDLSKSTCKDATIDNATIENFKNIYKCRQFTETSYKKYLPKYERYNCPIEYKCGLFLNEFNILIDNYYSLCKNGVSTSSNNIGANVLGNCSEAVFDLEQFYLKVKNYSCKYKAIANAGDTPTDKDIASETLEIIKQYNNNIDDLINTGNGGIKSNGIARGLCYAINIITGPFGKAVASLFIILLGMSFLSGHSESMSFKSLISIAFALALIFGAEQLANIISKNVYSCKYIILDK